MASDRPAAASAVRKGDELDWATIGRWLRGEVPELSGPLNVLQFPHGRANLTYLIEIGGTRLVLRRPPFGKIAPGAHDMGREFKVLSRLWRSYDRAPRAYAFTDDHSIAGADCFVMEYRDGAVIRDVLPDELRGQPDLGRRLMFGVVDAMADLHLVDPDECDLGDLGRPEGFVARQVSGWARRWELSAPEGGTAAEAMAQVGERLAATLPATQSDGIVHNDLKIDNCQYDLGDPDRVKSVFDWDMATLGDPLVDLGTLLNYVPDASDPPELQGAVRYPPELELPSRDEVAARYAERTGTDVGGVTWYLAFAKWKTATVYQQLANRALAGDSRNEHNAELSGIVPALARVADALLDELP
ncbi:phosphotransferase family protein [Pseudonocardia eucalypti]|uniref:Phosphotransferase family protein n=1 Tax=Pseudonocardia eucalypti TaxID=648755 RepID=A0ABP9Q557_9PSEU|nr:aminoglycoside phosphotransferase (APT) family kinase protein [Pseudonocardia eucalypti]